jgi:hypothetical protein
MGPGKITCLSIDNPNKIKASIMNNLMALSESPHSNRHKMKIDFFDDDEDNNDNNDQPSPNRMNNLVVITPCHKWKKREQKEPDSATFTDALDSIQESVEIDSPALSSRGVSVGSRGSRSAFSQVVSLADSGAEDSTASPGLTEEDRLSNQIRNNNTIFEDERPIFPIRGKPRHSNFFSEDELKIHPRPKSQILEIPATSEEDLTQERITKTEGFIPIPDDSERRPASPARRQKKVSTKNKTKALDTDNLYQKSLRPRVLKRTNSSVSVMSEIDFFDSDNKKFTMTSGEKKKILMKLIYQKLSVDRKGSVKESHMTTVSVEKMIDIDKVYEFRAGEGLIPIPEEEVNLPRNAPKEYKSRDNIPIDLKYQTFFGNWDCTMGEQDESNILGGNGKLFISTKDRQVKIPIEDATEQKLSYYKAHLMKTGDKIKFPYHSGLPMFKMNIGENYVQRYIMKKGGGFYLEYHTAPHYHEPLDEHSRGAYILAKEVGTLPNGQKKYHITAFKIPYGYAVYSEPGAIHDDAGTIGNWRVIYIDAKIFSTVTVFNEKQELIEFKFVDAARVIFLPNFCHFID